MEFLIQNQWALWLAVGIFFLIIELVTTALVSIWFVPAAVITCLVSLVMDSILWQILIFIALSAVFMVVFRRIYRKYIKKDRDEVRAEEKLIGKSAVTVEKTDSHGGKVLVGDVYWRAVSADGEPIEKDTTVIIRDVNGTTLITEKEN
ncbi:MAG: NfeD family protein [Oscillospiraceae bacterium]|nr:NfeD family protein [Oscillospiraceae bacterium]